MNEHATTDNSSHSPPALSWFVILIPTAIAVFVSFLSPNFRGSADLRDSNHRPGSATSDYPVRNTPLGADFLQEYVGGHIFWSPHRDQLYDPAWSKRVQHDPELVGFEWPEESVFPMVYPPFYYAASGLFSGLSAFGVNYLWSARIWLWLAGLAVSLSGWLLHRFYPPCRALVGPGLVGSILFVPLLHNFNLAQKGSLLLLILSATWVLLYRRQNVSAGMMFGLIAFKPHLGLPIGLAMLFKGQWRFCVGAVGVVVLLTGGSYAIAPQLWHDYVGVVGGMGDYVENKGYLLEDSHSLWGAMQLSVGRFSSTSAKVLAIVLGIGVIGLLVRVTRHRNATDSPAFAIQFAAMVIATIMLSPHFYTYDLVVLMLALLLIGSAVRAIGNRPLTEGKGKEKVERAGVETEGDVTVNEKAVGKESGENVGAGELIRERNSYRRLNLALLGLFCLAGIFPKIALATGVQLSVPCLMGLLWWMGNVDHHFSTKQNRIATPRKSVQR